MHFSYVTNGVGVGSEANSILAHIFQDRLCPSKSDNTRAMVADEDDGTGASILTLLRRRWGLE